MPEFQAPMLDMTNWPALAVDHVRSQQYSSAIDVFLRLKMPVPQALLDAWTAKLTAGTSSGRIYKAEMRDGRIRLTTTRPGKPAPASEEND